MTQEIDVRGLSCPQPAIQAKKAISNGEFPILVLADSPTACENMKRIAEGANLTVEVEQADGEFQLTIKE